MSSNFETYSREFLGSIFKNLAGIKEKEKRPLLAHYTSLEAFKKIIQNQNFLLSNPLCMNDIQEVRFGLSVGRNQLELLESNNEILRTIHSKDNFIKILGKFNLIFDDFKINHLKNTYVLCMSQYDEETHIHGSLSMWRGYGSNGQGAALIFDTKFLEYANDSPLFFGRVEYASNEDPIAKINEIYIKFFELIKDENIDDEFLTKIGKYIFDVTLFFSLLYKHNAFEEEKEWRMIYVPTFDTKSILTKNLTYLIQNNTIQPKLDFKIEPLGLEPNRDWTFDTILYRLLLGPSHSLPLALEATKQMLKELGKEHLIKKLVASDIPYLPHSGG
jgi:hypothetical protein